MIKYYGIKIIYLIWILFNNSALFRSSYLKEETYWVCSLLNNKSGRHFKMYNELHSVVEYVQNIFRFSVLYSWFAKIFHIAT
jgi:hypothetical protein